MKQQDRECDEGKRASPRHGGHCGEQQSDRQGLLTSGKHRGNAIESRQAQTATAVFGDDHRQGVQPRALDGQSREVDCRRPLVLNLQPPTRFDRRLGHDQQDEALRHNSNLKLAGDRESPEQRNLSRELTDNRRQEHGQREAADDWPGVDVCVR